MGVHITDDFHIYRVDWNPKKMIFYFDGQPYWSISLDRIMQSPFYKGMFYGESDFYYQLSFFTVSDISHCQMMTHFTSILGLG